jgi:methylmalonyl-CoA mutase C-terminal domain/subunit
MRPPIRVLLAKPTQDCHDRGVRYLARKLRDAGFEVVFANFLQPSEVVAIAAQEDVELVGISSSSGGHLPVFEELIVGLARSGLAHLPVIGGGVIPAEDVAQLREWGVKAVFGPGSSVDDVIALIRREFATHHGANP